MSEPARCLECYPPSFSFVVPVAPVPCARARVVRTKSGVRGVTPTSTRNYESTVGLVAKTRRPRGWPLDRNYELTIVVYRAAARGDWDNYAKAAGDGLNGIAWDDDRLVKEAHVRMVDGDSRPRLEVTVTLLDVPAPRKRRKKAA